MQPNEGQTLLSYLPPGWDSNDKVPHLKALTRSIEHRGGHWRGSTFKQHYTVKKGIILLHKWLKRRFHVMAAVFTHLKIIPRSLLRP